MECEVIKESTPKYKTIEAVVGILEKNGYVLKKVRTSGECSGHDCIDRFEIENDSIESFKENAYNDFKAKKERIKNYASLDWSDTSFKLIHNEYGYKVSLSIGEENGKTDPQKAYFFFRNSGGFLDEIVGTDKMYFDNLLLKLNDYLIK